MPRYSPRQETEFASFKALLPDSTDDKLLEQCKHYIWLSAYAGNNPNSNYHRMCDACCDEAQRRGKPEIYTAAYDAIAKSV